MDKRPSEKDPTEAPAPEVLAPRTGDSEQASAETSKPTTALKAEKHLRRSTYRPSHRATFIGLAVVVGILAINAGIITFVIKSQNKPKTLTTQGDVTISQTALDQLGVNRSAVGDLGTELVVGPNSRFNGTVKIGKDVSIGGQLKLNSKFTASDASLTQLEAGNTSLTKLNVNGDSTVSNLNLRNDLVVTGLSRLQGPVTMSQLLTVNNNVNVAGNLAVGGTLSVNNFHASTLVLDSTLTIGGHVITRGSAPGVGPCSSALGSNGTVSISGNDMAGTVGINAGTGAIGGCLAQVAFRNQYATTPHVVVTPIGNVGSFYITRTSSGFSIYVGSGLNPGGYAFDYIVEQ